MSSARACAPQAVEGDDAQQLVAVDDLAPLVDGHAAVGVAVEAEAHVAATLGDDGGQRGGHRRTAARG